MARVLLSAASSLYGAIVRRRRAWYADVPDRQRRLARPVISVGNLTVGGSGKTPVVEHLARLLMAAGERPVILSRGYARRVADAGVTVVSDGHRILADVDRAGDEPLMMARHLPTVPVLVAPDRLRSGQLAEAQMRATVHILDDGFQHVTLARDIDLLVVHEDDLADRVLPEGRLREPLSAAAAADAVLVTATSSSPDDQARAMTAIQAALDVRDVFAVRRWLAPVHMFSSKNAVEPAAIGPVLAVAGIARPERLFTDLSAAGWRVAGVLTFPDHHRFQAVDIARIAAAANDAHTHVIVTTEKDAVRLEPLDCSPLALAVAPLSCAVEPAAPFERWLLAKLAEARARRALVDEGRPEAARS